jgi:two-component system, NtrC family, nitrogen regulation sensor histidine kinase NtrY
MRRILVFLKRNWLSALFAAAVVSAVVTYFIASNSEHSVGEQSNALWALLMSNVVLLLGIAAVYARRVWRMREVLEATLMRSKLQKRIVLVFGVVTVLPTLVIALASFFFFNLGIQTWFNDRVSTALQESLAVAEAYLAEHKENIRLDALAMADDLNKAADLAYSSPVDFNRVVSMQASARLLAEAMVFQKNRIIAQGRLSFAMAFESVPMNAIERAQNGEVVIIPDDNGDKVRALVKLDAIPEGYLMVGRLIDSKVQGYTDKAQGAFNDYMELRQNLHRLQFTFSLVFFSLSLMLLVSAVWYALVFATRLTTPITHMAAAAERIRSGDFSARVKASVDEDEINALGRTFNRMAEQLQAQRTELIEANRTLDERRRLTEAVLAGVSAGVIALDAQKVITLANPSAQSLLDVPLVGQSIDTVLPEFVELIEKAEDADTLVQGDVALKNKTFHLRLSAEREDKDIRGFIITFDDITPLISAQRQAAWSDVARRIAHEIKNPLTPIALAAERLKRKYAKLAEDEENFTKYTDTIAQHVGNIGKMVDEFVSFARMPTPQFKPEVLQTIIQKVVFSEQVAHGNVEYRVQLPAAPVEFSCDERQISQALLNLLKNAAEALEGAEVAAPVISIALTVEPRKLVIDIRDNGAGFPQEKIEECFEPYITTRAKGTGLGLSITKKIIEDHKGNIVLANAPEGGAWVTVTFLQV